MEAELERRHGDDPAWQVAGEQSAVIGQLINDRELVGTLIVATRLDAPPVDGKDAEVVAKPDPLTRVRFAPVWRQR